MTPTDSILNYLKMISDVRAENTWRTDYTYAGLEALVLKYGHIVETYPALSIPEANVSVPRGAKKACYENSWRIATTDRSGDLLYTEGFAVTHSIPLNHAWLTHRPTGKIIDPTWEASQDTTVYMGIKFDTWFVRDRTTHTGFPSILAPNERTPEEFMTGGFITDDDGVVIGVGKPLDN